MPIRIKENSIEFIGNNGNITTLLETSTGFTLSGGDIRGHVSGGGISETSGYTSGGYAPAQSNVIDKFPFASSANATDVGDLTVARYGAVGQSSSVSGYSSGGFTNVIDKFPFAADANATDVGDLTVARTYAAGNSSSVSGYTSGGFTGVPVPAPVMTNVIDKFPFATNANATDVGDLSPTYSLKRGMSGQSSSEAGYVSAGYALPAYPLAYLSNVDKFPFATNANATQRGTLLTVARAFVSGQSSSVSGYVSGGRRGPTASPVLSNVIDKFPFASDAAAVTDVGDLSSAREYDAGQSSSTYGYSTGSDRIDRFPFATDASATDVANLSVPRYIAAGQSSITAIIVSQ